MLNMLLNHMHEAAAVALFCIGFTTLLLNKNLIKKIIGFSMRDNAIYLFLASYGYIRGRLAPIYIDGNTDPALYVNPLPAGLVLTGIVVSVSVTAILLALTVRLYRHYHTLNIDEIAETLRAEGK